MVAGGYPEEDGLCGTATAAEISMSKSADKVDSAESAEDHGGEESPPIRFEKLGNSCDISWTGHQRIL